MPCCQKLRIFRQKSRNLRGKQALLSDQSGATAIEYVVLLAAIVLVSIAAAGQIADNYRDQASILNTTLGKAENRVTQTP